MRKFSRWVRYFAELMGWLVRARPIIAIGIALLMVPLLSVVFPCPEPRIRWIGMGLQLAGVLLAAVGLWDTRRAFDNEPTTWQAILNWLSLRPKFGPKTFHLSGEPAIYVSEGGAARFRISAGPNAPLDQRIALLENQINRLEDEVGELTSKTKDELKRLKDDIERERSERTVADDGIRKQLRSAVAAGLPLARVGAAFFFIGIAASTASPEIAKLLASSSCQ